MEDFRKSHNTSSPEIKLTGLVFVIKALVSALKQCPQFNSSLSADRQSLILKKYCNIGIAVETPNGLVVPVIQDADQMNLNQLSEALVELSGKAREGKLPPSAMQGGSMSISSLGGIGGTAFTPIVNAPEVAILGVSRSKIQPVWQGNEFVPRLMLPLDLTYDHRVIDGAEAARFLVSITQYLSDIRRLLL
jgi:pyruvate dehydrogenase E2 component (dihydrolipoamide acetyltransferase)